MVVDKNLRNKNDFIEALVDSVSVDEAIDQEWQAFIAASREAEPEAVTTEESLRPEATGAFMAGAFGNGELRTPGTAVTRVLPPTSRFAADGSHGQQKQRVTARLAVFFERFFGLSPGNGA